MMIIVVADRSWMIVRVVAVMVVVAVDIVASAAVAVVTAECG